MLAFLLLMLRAMLFETVPDPATTDEPEADDEPVPDDNPEDEPDEPKLTPRQERIRDAKMKELSDEAKRWRLKFREAEKQIAALEDGTQAVPAEVREARLEAAFLRSVLTAGQLLDVESAWDLANARGFFDNVKDDGAGMDKALESLVDRYPWLTEDAPADAIERPALPKTGGAKKKPDASAAVTQMTLRERFPALRRSR